MSKKYIITNITNVDPTVSDNIAAGYALAQDWFNETTGERFYHKADGVWVSYSATGTNTEAPIMFADVATTAQFNGIYDNGVGGVGATLTSITDGSINIDGVPLNLDVVVLVKDQSYTGDPFDIDYRPQNGVYIVTQEGTPSLPVILTRVDFADETEELYPSQVNILDGIVNINKFFLQKTVDPALGTDAVLYETNLIPPAPQVILPVIFVDTATSGPLPSCTYANIYNTPIVPGPGQPWYIPYPISATITANANGPLGTINGVVIANTFLNRNNRILVKNQANPVHNGDYQVVNAGSSTMPWKLQRITTTGGSMVRSAREWKVNNESSTLYGNRYNLVNTAGAFIKVGINSINFSEISTSNAQTFIEVTYAELVALKTGSLLIPGQTYLLTDYMTTYTQPISGATMSSGIVEPLYITATDVNMLHNECKSELYPQDIVFYEITGNIGNDVGTEGFTKGKIYRRIDTLRNNDIGTDWRHITYRRYQLDNTYVPEAVIGNTYVKGDVVKNVAHPDDFNICIKDTVHDGSFNFDKWTRFIYANGEFKSFSLNNIEVFAINSALIPVNNSSFEDSVMFPEYDVPNDGYPVINTVIKTYHLHNSIIYELCKDNEIGDFFDNNTINNLSKCNISSDFLGNYINESHSNTIGYDYEADKGFNNNIITNISSTISDGRFEKNWLYNTSGFKFYNNKISTLFSFNIINGYDFYNNIIGAACLANTITKIFSGNVLSDNFSNNIINRSIVGSAFGNHTTDFDIPYNTQPLGNWTFGNDIDGTLITLPELSSNDYTKKLIKANTKYIAEYIDEYGDDIIMDNLEASFVFKSTRELFEIYVYTSTSSNTITIDWGDGSTYTSPSGNYQMPNGLYRTHTYTGKLDNEEYYIKITGGNIDSIYIGGNEMTYFEPLKFPSTLTELNIEYQSLLTFDPVNLLPDQLEYLYVSELQLTSFDPTNHRLPTFLKELALNYNSISSFDTTLPLPSGLIELGLYDNQLTVFDPGTLATPLPNSLEQLNLGSNLITSFDPTVALPNNLQLLYLNANQLTVFDPTIALPSGLVDLNLIGNALTSFDPGTLTNPLPSSLTLLSLNLNPLMTFDPTAALPSGLIGLSLSSCQLTSFNPTIPLPSTLQNLSVSYNQLTSFNPTQPLPLTLTLLQINNNLLSTAEVNNTLVMLNNRYTVNGSKSFYLNMTIYSPPTGAGITAKLAMQAKGYYVQTN